MPKAIQEQFGERVLEIITEFARTDLKTADELAKDEFGHVADRDLRDALSQVHYGVRWIYKLGLALLVRDHERAAHVRAQIVDYASLVEALLSYFIAHAIRRGHTVGDAYKWQDPDGKTRQISWSPSSIDSQLRRRPLWWVIRVAAEFGIIGRNLEVDLDWLRKQRNAVHIRERAAIGSMAYLNHSKTAFALVNRTITATKTWRATHS